MLLTKQQRQAVKRTFDRSADGAGNYLEFRRRVVPAGLVGTSLVMLRWCGMWLGIEADGYTHS